MIQSLAGDILAAGQLRQNEILPRVSILIEHSAFKSAMQELEWVEKVTDKVR